MHFQSKKLSFPDVFDIEESIFTARYAQSDNEGNMG